MRVTLGRIEYTLYISAADTWTMHTFDTSRPEGAQYIDTHYNVSNINPFLSGVQYDAWS